MNTQAIQILFLKDLFLSRWPMFGYLVGGLLSVMVTCLPGESAGFIGFILMITVTRIFRSMTKWFRITRMHSERTITKFDPIQY
jgi:hypothetical protein